LLSVCLYWYSCIQVDSLCVQILCFWTLSIILFVFKSTTFRRLEPVSVVSWNLLGSVQSAKRLSISEHLQQHKIKYTSQAQHRPSVRVKTKYTKTPHAWGLAPEYYQNRSHHWRDKFSVWYQHKKHKFSHSVYTGCSCSYLTSAVIMEVQVREMSRLGSLTD
jgi:hypothetical protein